MSRYHIFSGIDLINIIKFSVIAVIVYAAFFILGKVFKVFTFPIKILCFFVVCSFLYYLFFLWKGELVYRIKLFVLSIIIATIACATFFILVPYKFMRVMSSSMEPTLSAGDLIAYKPFTDVSRGDIIVFFSDDDKNKTLVKRVIGVSGDTIDIVEDGVYVNSILYITGKIQNTESHYTVPQESVFVLGDNYEISVDSRYWKDPFIKQDNILGVVYKR